MACLIDCIIAGSVDPNEVGREKIKRILNKRPHFGATILAGRREDTQGTLHWVPDVARVRNVVLKLARGHSAYELSEPRLAEPERVWFGPLGLMSAKQRDAFESEPTHSGWPELGSRAFMRACVVGGVPFLGGGWQVVQLGRYRYLVMDDGTVRVVMSEYLACEVVW